MSIFDGVIYNDRLLPVTDYLITSAFNNHHHFTQSEVVVMPSYIQDHSSNVYLTASISRNSALYQNPAQLASHPALTYVGQVGELRDVQLLSVSRDEWPRVQGDVLGYLDGLDGVQRVDVQAAPHMRAKRDVSDL